jgi:hypothetical protein
MSEVDPNVSECDTTANADRHKMVLQIFMLMSVLPIEVACLSHNGRTCISLFFQ